MSHRGSRSLGLQFLMERRAREEANAFYNEAAAEDNLTRQRAQFETRTLNRYQGGEIKRRAKQHSEEQAALLDQRRQKLAKLLSEEEAQYMKEIQSTVETPQSRRERLKQQLAVLRQRRQEEHDTYVAEKMNKAGETRATLSDTKYQTLFRSKLLRNVINSLLNKNKKNLKVMLQKKNMLHKLNKMYNSGRMSSLKKSKFAAKRCFRTEQHGLVRWMKRTPLSKKKKKRNTKNH